MTYPTITPEEVHPSHDVREEGLYVTDPFCQYCRLGAVDNGEALKRPCEGKKSDGVGIFVNDHGPFSTVATAYRDVCEGRTGAFVWRFGCKS